MHITRHCTSPDLSTSGTERSGIMLTGNMMAKRTPSGRDMEFFEDDDEPMTIEPRKLARTRSGRDEEFDMEGDGQECARS